MVTVTLYLALVASAAPAEAAVPPPGTIDADVLVYGATAAGCVAAIAASRSGARRVTVATPYGHIGGMTTGGIMHADGGNSTVIHGITREYFERVMSHYPSPSPSPPHPHGSPYSFACRAGRCIEQDDVPGNQTDPTCSGVCAPLAANEWLAVTFLSQLSADKRTLTVKLPSGQKTSFIKKSEKPAKDLPKLSARQIKDGQVLQLVRPAVAVDKTYLLIELAATDTAAPTTTAASPLGRRHSLLPPAPKAGGPGCEDPQHPRCWLYESHVAERVLEEMLAEANVTIVRHLVGLAGATRSRAGALESVSAEDGTTLRAKVWIDGSYEGDLAYVGGADMVWGRESKAQYGEHGAGRRPVSLTYHVDPYWPDGSVIPHVYTEPGSFALGQADDRIEVYDFRLCLTNSPGHRLAFTQPASYNASEWELWRRLYIYTTFGLDRDPGLTEIYLRFGGLVSVRPLLCDGAGISTSRRRTSKPRGWVALAPSPTTTPTAAKKRA
jgi:hypothetical protein